MTVEALLEVGRSSPIPLVMQCRLHGGSSSVPGDWLRSRCHISGCWPTKSRCFRCGAPRKSAPQDAGPCLPRRESHPRQAAEAQTCSGESYVSEVSFCSLEERWSPLLVPLLPLLRRPLHSWTRRRSSRCFEVWGSLKIC